MFYEEKSPSLDGVSLIYMSTLFDVTTLEIRLIVTAVVRNNPREECSPVKIKGGWVG